MLAGAATCGSSWNEICKICVFRFHYALQSGTQADTTQPSVGSELGAAWQHVKAPPSSFFLTMSSLPTISAFLVPLMAGGVVPCPSLLPCSIQRCIILSFFQEATGIAAANTDEQLEEGKQQAAAKKVCLAQLLQLLIYCGPAVAGSC